MHIVHTKKHQFYLDRNFSFIIFLYILLTEKLYIAKLFYKCQKRALLWVHRDEHLKIQNKKLML